MLTMLPASIIHKCQHLDHVLFSSQSCDDGCTSASLPSRTSRTKKQQATMAKKVKQKLAQPSKEHAEDLKVGYLTFSGSYFRA